MRYAIIESGGKQYRAVEGETVEVDRLELEVGKKVELKGVLLVADGETVLVGAPTLSDARISATVVAQDKGPKITVFKYKPKIRYRVKTGHRQQITRLQINSIDVKGISKAEAKEEAAKSETAAKPAARRSKPKASAKKPADRAKAKTKK
jgi:large subunit ribosomal protein L21